MMTTGIALSVETRTVAKTEMDVLLFFFTKRQRCLLCLVLLVCNIFRLRSTDLETLVLLAYKIPDIRYLVLDL